PGELIKDDDLVWRDTRDEQFARADGQTEDLADRAAVWRWVARNGPQFQEMIAAPFPRDGPAVQRAAADHPGAACGLILCTAMRGVVDVFSIAHDGPSAVGDAVVNARETADVVAVFINSGVLPRFIPTAVGEAGAIGRDIEPVNLSLHQLGLAAE